MRLLPTSVTLLSLLTAAGGASAQPPPSGAETAIQVTVARALLEQGQRLLQEGRLKDALDKLDESVRQDATPEGLLSLAACQEKLGATASAWGTLHRAEERARATGDQGRAAQAAQRATALEPRLSHLRVVVTGAARTSAITLDEQPLAKDAWGVPLPLDPGQHMVKATSAGAPAAPSFSKTFELFAQESREITIPDLAPPAPPPPIAPAPAPEPESSPPPAPKIDRVSPIYPVPVDAWSSGTDWRSAWVAGISLMGIGAGAALVGFSVMYLPSRPSDTVVVGGASTLGGGLLVGVTGLVLALVAEKHHGNASLAPRFDLHPFVARGTGGLTLHGAF